MSRLKLLAASLVGLSLMAGSCLAGPFGGRVGFNRAGTIQTAALPTHYVLERTIGTIPSWHPLNLAVDGDGYIYFIDGRAAMVRKLAPGGGAVVRSWGGVGSDNGKFREPHGLEVDSLGYVYVLDIIRHNIQKFTRQGLFLRQWLVDADTRAIAISPSGRIYSLTSNRIYIYSPNGAVGNSPITDVGPGARDLAIDPAGNIFVLRDEPCVAKYDSAGVSQGKIISGPANAEYLEDGHLAVNATRIYVSRSGQAPLATAFNKSGVLQGTYGAFGGGNGQGVSGNDVAVDEAGNFYVSDVNEARIQEFNASGVYQTKWGYAGTGDGQFRGPGGIVVDTSGNIYVTDVFNRRVQKFDSSGAFVSKFGVAGANNGQFQFPLGIALANGKLFITDMILNRVQRFTTAGVYEAKWGSSGSNDGQFSSPGAITVAPSTGNVYVCDQGNHRVQYFNSAGAFQGQFGGAALQYPWGIAMSGTQVCVVDEELGEVFKYSLTGAAAGSWGTSGDGYGQFDSPKMMASDTAGKLWIADWEQGWAQQFTSAGAVQNVVQVADTAHPYSGNLMGCAVGPGNKLYLTDLIYQQVYVLAPSASPAVAGSVAVNALSASAVTSGRAQITFTLSASADVTIEVANIAGRCVRLLTANDCSAGSNTALWDGRSNSGAKSPAGPYLVKLTARAAGGQQASSLTRLNLGR